MWSLEIKMPQRPKGYDLFNRHTQAQKHSSESCWNWVQSLLAYWNKVPNTKMVFQGRAPQDCKERKCACGSAWNGDFPPAAETKPSSFPLKYHVANAYEIHLLSCPSRSFLGLTNFQVLNFLGISVFLINFHSCVSFSKWNLGIPRLV